MAETGNTVSLGLRDAIYLYGQPLNGKCDKILAGNNCDVFQMILNVNTGHTDLAMSQSSTLDNAISTQAPYPDRIFTTAGMFSCCMVKTFAFNDKTAPGSSSQTGTANVFGYCYSTKPNARVYIREKAKCMDKYSTGQTSAIVRSSVNSSSIMGNVSSLK